MQDDPGGETQDTKRGGGGLDFFGGSGSGDAEKSAEKNVEKAKSTETSITPDNAKVVGSSFPKQYPSHSYFVLLAPRESLFWLSLNRGNVMSA